MLHDVREDVALPVTYHSREALERIASGGRWAPFTIGHSHTGLTVVAPEEISAQYAPIGLKAVGALPPAGRQARLAWTYLADEAVEEPALVGARVLAPAHARTVRYLWRPGWFAQLPVEALKQRDVALALSATGFTRSSSGRASSVWAPLGEWVEHLHFRVWAPILSTHELVRILGATEEYKRLTAQAVAYSRLTRERLVAAGAKQGLSHRELAELAGISRRRIDQILAEEQLRASRTPGIARVRAIMTPTELEQIVHELQVTAHDVEEKEERDRRAVTRRREIHRRAAEAGFSHQAVADLLNLSKPRVQQLRAERETKIGPLRIVSAE